MRACWVLVFLLGCDGAEPVDAGTDAGVDAGATDAGALPAPMADYLEPGPFPVGNVRVALEDTGRGRTLPVEIWYPAAQSARADAMTGQPLSAFEREAPRDGALAGLLADAPSCVRTQTRSADAPEPEPDGGAWPLVVFSHCHVCTRFDVASIAERLASFGIAVAAPDHEGNTLYDELDGTAAMVGETFLEVRVGDVRFVRDALLADDPALPMNLRGRFDAARVGVMGHSFGAATAGVAASEDDGFVAGLALAAPITALSSGLRASDIDTPFLFFVAREDNSIGEVGNDLMRNEHRRLGAPGVLVELDDAGHWSFSDYPGLLDLFEAGCGMGTRQTVPGESFSYLAADVARDVTGDVVVSYFAMHLLDDPGGLTPILEGHPSGLLSATPNGR